MSNVRPTGTNPWRCSKRGTCCAAGADRFAGRTARSVAERPRKSGRANRTGEAAEQIADLRARSREDGDRESPQAESRAAAKSVPRSCLSRADERLLRAGEAAEDRVPRPGGKLHARGRGAEVRQQR